MPCNGGGAMGFDAYGESNTQRRDKAKIDLLTQMLCAMIRTSPDIPYLTSEQMDAIHPKLWKWWKEHEAADKKRVAEENRLKDIADKKAAALKKLTKVEKELLGLK